MEEHLKDLNQTLNRMISEEPKFTEQNRSKIRKVISKKRNQSGSKYYRNWKAFISVAASLLLIVASVQFILNQSNGYESSMDKASGGSDASADQSAAADSAENAATLEKYSQHREESKGHAESTAEAQREFNALDQNTKMIDQKTIEGPVLPLNEKLLNVYEKFSNSHDQRELEGLEPFEVMQLYYYGVQQENHSTQYDLYSQKSGGTPESKQQFLDSIKKHPTSRSSTEKMLNELNSVKSFDLGIELNPLNQKEAYITWGGTGESMRFFRLIFNEELNVWTVSWTPMQ
ncbi:hypothetical protein [Alkalihalobacillus sp. AL-G]|uniref:hypothetical protein n=1 Tax=Alkalihalobacillus sp. AL-G TaxID=2926399 RepID=UPI00272D6FC0|nr:hypothetical protein [Alkalihalobacillus sp. AL-G]WLD93647.1 hypothetical protein MOJ78_01530 [Alkalihalobacillus sp. AL-G]